MFADFSLLLKPPDIFYSVGVLFIVAATACTYMGKVWVRFTGWVYRDTEPGWFWYEVAVDYLLGALFIGYFLYKVYGPSH